ncbi:GIY-YIG nuclease family protein [bacterium]|nr:GIY-YIG nuclease family protein [bacterium]
MASFVVYILQSQSTGETYVGQTNDIDRRLAQHNDPEFRGTLHTKRRQGPWKLLHQEEFMSRSDAMRRERWLKSGSGYRFIRHLLSGDRADAKP